MINVKNPIFENLLLLEMKILVTGAAGFIGSHMAEALARQGHEVIGLDNFAPYYNRSLKELNREAVVASGSRFIVGDLLDNLETMLPDDIEIIYHFAAQPGISSSTDYRLYKLNNIQATQNLFKWAKGLARLQMFVNISTSSVYGLEAIGNEEAEPSPASDYGMTKLAAEQFVMQESKISKTPVCSIRLYSVYGPRERPEKLYTKLIKAILEDTSFPLYEGSEMHLRSFSYVGDVIQGMIKILNHLEACNGQIINLGNDQVYSTAEGIEMVEELLGKKAVLTTKVKRAGDQRITTANIDKARHILMYEPSTSFKEGLRAQIEWFKENFYR